LITPSQAKEVVSKQWSTNRDAFLSRDRAEAYKLMSSIEAGPALAADLTGIDGRLDAGASNPSQALAPRLADHLDVIVLVPHQRRWPGVFLARVSQPNPAPSVAAGTAPQPPPPGVTWQFLVFAEDHRGAGWRNVLYGDIDDPSGGLGGVTVGPDGYAASSPASSAVEKLGHDFAAYVGDGLNNKNSGSGKFANGPHTSDLVHGLGKSVSDGRARGVEDRYVYHDASLPYLPLVLNTNGGKLVVTVTAVDHEENVAKDLCLRQDPSGNSLSYGVPPGQYRRVDYSGIDALAISVPANGGPAGVLAYGYMQTSTSSNPC
jgi:hypothetical protein